MLTGHDVRSSSAWAPSQLRIFTGSRLPEFMLRDSQSSVLHQLSVSPTCTLGRRPVNIRKVPAARETTVAMRFAPSLHFADMSHDRRALLVTGHFVHFEHPDPPISELEPPATNDPVTRFRNVADERPAFHRSGSDSRHAKDGRPCVDLRMSEIASRLRWVSGRHFG